MTSPATQARGGRQATWTRDIIIERILRWNSLYGEPPRAADWNPSAAKWSGAEWRTERYRQGDPETGEPWPSLNATKKLFDGSLTKAILAAGLEPAKPGPPSRREVAAPDVVERMVMSPEARVALEAARAEVARLEGLVGTRDGQIERLRARLAERPARVETKTKTKTITKVVRERVADDAAVARARSRAEAAVSRAEAARDAAVAKADEARAEAREARTAATKLASRLERAEATIASLRDDRRALTVERDRAADRAVAAERELEEERAREAVPEVREVVVEREVVSASAVEVEAARKRAHEAELRAAAAERKQRELAALVTGEQRMLTPAEVAELRRGGPSGEKILGRALRSLAAARQDGGKVPLKAALTEIASAAIRWRDSLP